MSATTPPQPPIENKSGMGAAILKVSSMLIDEWDDHASHRARRLSKESWIDLCTAIANAIADAEAVAKAGEFGWGWSKGYVKAINDCCELSCWACAKGIKRKPSEENEYEWVHVHAEGPQTKCYSGTYRRRLGDPGNPFVPSPTKDDNT